MIARKRKKAWEKILYRKLEFPDNYTDEVEFLADLRKNGKSEIFEKKYLFQLKKCHFSLKSDKNFIFAKSLATLEFSPFLKKMVGYVFVGSK